MHTHTHSDRVRCNLFPLATRLPLCAGWARPDVGQGDARPRAQPRHRAPARLDQSLRCVTDRDILLMAACDRALSTRTSGDRVRCVHCARRHNLNEHVRVRPFQWALWADVRHVLTLKVFSALCRLLKTRGFFLSYAVHQLLLSCWVQVRCALLLLVAASQRMRCDRALLLLLPRDRLQ